MNLHSRACPRIYIFPFSVKTREFCYAAGLRRHMCPPYVRLPSMYELLLLRRITKIKLYCIQHIYPGTARAQRHSHFVEIPLSSTPTLDVFDHLEQQTHTINNTPKSRIEFQMFVGFHDSFLFWVANGSAVRGERIQAYFR